MTKNNYTIEIFDNIALYEERNILNPDDKLLADANIWTSCKHYKADIHENLVIYELSYTEGHPHSSTFEVKYHDNSQDNPDTLYTFIQ